MRVPDDTGLAGAEVSAPELVAANGAELGLSREAGAASDRVDL